MNSSKDINIVALAKQNQQYIFLFKDKNEGKALQQLGKFACNPQLNFSWYDAAICSQKIRNSKQKLPVNSPRFT